MPQDLIIGVDSSTSATKVIVFDQDGAIVAISTNGYKINAPKPGWSEQDPADWWTAFKKGCAEVMAHPNVSTDRISGIGITHQRFTFVPVNEDMEPLRPAILWNDIRCSDEAEYARSEIGGAHVFERTGYSPGQWTLYKALWLKRNEPEIYNKTYKLLLVQDYLIQKLTGQLVTLTGAATMTGALDIADRHRWAEDVIDAMGVRRDIWIDNILPGCAEAGRITSKAASETGLPEGLPVITTAGDQPCGILGAGVTNPGQIGINGGTSCTNEFVVEGLPARDAEDYMIEVSPTGDYVVENYIPSGGSALMNWYRANLGAADVAEAEATGQNMWDRIYGLAAQSPVGNHGVMVLPFFQGANGPFWNLDARGMIFGLHTEYGRPQIVRGIIEGLAYECRRQARLMEKGTGAKVKVVRMYGGSAASDHWNQAFADIFRTPVEVPDTPEATALGAGIAAAVGVGLFGTCREAAQKMIKIRKTYSPISENADLYDRYYSEVYEPLYAQTRHLMAANAAINRNLTE